jgi:SNF2 family DNA or RNA helicase
MTSLIISKATKQELLVPVDAKIKALWPQAKTLEHNGTTYAIIPHGPREQIQLRAAEIAIPAPILSHYDWAGGEPFAIQKTTAALATSNTRAYVLNDMGTGKTRAAIWSWHFLHKAGVAGKLLVVAPLSTLKFVWQREVSSTLPGVKSVVLHGSKKKRLELLDSNASVFIINHDGLKTIQDELARAPTSTC